MVKQNKFVIISTVYNKEKWVGFNIHSIKQQSYGNFLAVYGYDESVDKSIWELYRNIGQDERFKIVANEDKDSQMSNFFHAYNHLKENNLIDPEDIIVEVDADDWLLHCFVLEYLNQAYQNPNTWMTYGQYIEYPSGKVGGHFNMHLVDGSQRNVPFAYSHLKTYKAWLLDLVPKEDLINPETGKYWKTTADFAMCMPMVEMAGIDRIHRIEEPIYVYNSGDDIYRESSSQLQEQKRVEQIIRSLKPKQKL
jgi:glycosyltransferase involved in cell wall biosynthesis